MKITPLDIDQQEFQKVFRGCDPEEVRDFLNQVSRQLEDVVKENQRLQEQIRRQERQLDEFRAHETQLREALSSAGRMTDDIRASAEKEAELLKAQAEVKAEQIVVDARNELARLSGESRSLRLQKHVFCPNLRRSSRVIADCWRLKKSWTVRPYLSEKHRLNVVKRVSAFVVKHDFSFQMKRKGWLPPPSTIAELYR